MHVESRGSAWPLKNSHVLHPGASSSSTLSLPSMASLALSWTVNHCKSWILMDIMSSAPRKLSSKCSRFAWIPCEAHHKGPTCCPAVSDERGSTCCILADKHAMLNTSRKVHCLVENQKPVSVTWVLAKPLVSTRAHQRALATLIKFTAWAFLKMCLKGFTHEPFDQDTLSAPFLR